MVVLARRCAAWLVVGLVCSACVLTSHSGGRFARHGNADEEATTPADAPAVAPASGADIAPEPQASVVSPCGADPTRPALEASALRERARAEGAPAGGRVASGESFAPLLPAAWPSTDGRALVLAFDYQALPSGIVSFRVRGPVRQARISVADGAVERIPTGSVRTLGIDREPFRTEEDERALRAGEAALVGVLAGRICLEDARPALRGYCAYARRGGPEARFAMDEAPAFFADLRCDAEPSAL